MIYSNYMREKYRNTNIPMTAEGYPCILKKSKKGNLKELVIEGNTGKNLFDISKITKFVKYNNGGFDIETTGSTISDGVIVNNEGIYQSSIFAWDSRTELEAGTYTISADFMSNRDDGNKHAVLYVRDYNSSDIIFEKSKELTAYKSWENVSGTFTLSKKTTIVIAPMGGGVPGDWKNLNMNIKNIQLELGSTATEYEPYKAVGDLITDGDYAGKYKIPLTVHGKNLFNGYGFSAQGMITPTASRVLSNAVDTTISTTSPSNTLTVTQSNIYDSGPPYDYRNGYFCIGLNEDIKIGKKYRFYCDAEITNNPLNVSAFDLAPNNLMWGYTATYNNGKLSGTFLYAKNGTRRYLEFRNRGCNMTISNIMITESKIKDNIYEPFLNPMTTNIYLDNPLGSGECLDFKRQKLIKATSQTDVALPKVQVFKGTSVIRTDTEVNPTNIKAKYIKY